MAPSLDIASAGLDVYYPDRDPLSHASERYYQTPDNIYRTSNTGNEIQEDLNEEQMYWDEGNGAEMQNQYNYVETGHMEGDDCRPSNGGHYLTDQTMTSGGMNADVLHEGQNADYGGGDTLISDQYAPTSDQYDHQPNQYDHPPNQYDHLPNHYDHAQNQDIQGALWLPQTTEPQDDQCLDNHDNSPYFEAHNDFPPFHDNRYNAFQDGGQQTNLLATWPPPAPAPSTFHNETSPRKVRRPAVGQGDAGLDGYQVQYKNYNGLEAGGAETGRSVGHAAELQTSTRNVQVDTPMTRTFEGSPPHLPVLSENLQQRPLLPAVGGIDQDYYMYQGNRKCFYNK